MTKAAFLIALLSALSLFGQQVPPHSPTSLKSLIKETEPGILQIYTRPSPDSIISGTGFLVSKDGYIITALHVVSDGKGKMSQTIKVSLPTPPVEVPGLTMTSDMADVTAQPID